MITEEEKWVAAGQQRAPRTRQDLAGFIDPSVLRDALATAALTQRSFSPSALRRSRVQHFSVALS